MVMQILLPSVTVTLYFLPKMCILPYLSIGECTENNSSSKKKKKKKKILKDISGSKT